MENKKRKQGICTLIIIFMIFIIMYAIFFMANFNKLNKLKIYTSKTEGTVTKYKTYSKSTSGRYKQTKHYHDITINYTVDGKIYNNENKYAGKNGEIFKVGEKITILYDPTDSEKIIPEKIANWQKNNYKKGEISSVVMTVITTAFFGLVYYNGKNKKNRR